jgi:hypothetical protein
MMSIPAIWNFSGHVAEAIRTIRGVSPGGMHPTMTRRAHGGVPPPAKLEADGEGDLKSLTS